MAGGFLTGLTGLLGLEIWLGVLAFKQLTKLLESTDECSLPSFRIQVFAS